MRGISRRCVRLLCDVTENPLLDVQLDSWRDLSRLIEQASVMTQTNLDVSPEHSRFTVNREK